MRRLNRMMVSLSLALAGATCSAQNSNIPQKSTIPFAEIEHGNQVSASFHASGGGEMILRPSEADPAFSSSSGFSYVQPVYKRPRVMDSRFFLVNGLHLGLAAIDIALTQHCIAAHRCREGNPLMPSSLAGQVGVDSAFVGYSAFVSFRLKRQDSRVWWLSPSIGIGAHAAGVVTGLVNR